MLEIDLKLMSSSMRTSEKLKMSNILVETQQTTSEMYSESFPITFQAKLEKVGRLVGHLQASDDNASQRKSFESIYCFLTELLSLGNQAEFCRNARLNSLLDVSLGLLPSIVNMMKMQNSRTPRLIEYSNMMYETLLPMHQVLCLQRQPTQYLPELTNKLKGQEANYDVFVVTSGHLCGLLFARSQYNVHVLGAWNFETCLVGKRSEAMENYCRQHSFTDLNCYLN